MHKISSAMVNTLLQFPDQTIIQNCLEEHLSLEKASFQKEQIKKRVVEAVAERFANTRIFSQNLSSRVKELQGDLFIQSHIFDPIHKQLTSILQECAKEEEVLISKL